MERLEPSLSFQHVYTETQSFRDILSLCGRKDVVTVLDGQMSSSQVACLAEYARNYDNLFLLESCEASDLSPAALSTGSLVSVSHKDPAHEEEAMCDRILNTISIKTSLPENSIRNGTSIASILKRCIRDCFHDITAKRHATTSIVSCILACIKETNNITLGSLEAVVIFSLIHVGIASSFRTSYEESQMRVCDVIRSALDMGKDLIVPLPDEELLSKYYFDTATNTWLSWERLLPVALEQHFDESLVDMVIPVRIYLSHPPLI